MSHLKKLALGSLTLLVFLAPTISSAQSVSSLQAQIASLLATVQALQAQLGTSSSTVIPAPNDNENSGTVSATSTQCPSPVLTMTLYRGQRDAQTGGQVSSLQDFLADYFNLPGSFTTGYFGVKTEQYVQQFQARRDIAQVGYVGKLTRAAIQSECTGTQPTTSSTTGSLSVLDSVVSNGTLQYRITVPAQYAGAYMLFMENPVSTVTPISSGSFMLKRIDENWKGGTMTGSLNVKSAHEGFATNDGGVHWFELPSGTYTLGAVIYSSSPFKPGTDMEFLPIGTEPPAIYILNSSPFSLQSGTASTPTARLLINGSHGPLTLADEAPITLTWTSSGATSCYITNVRRTHGAVNAAIENLAPSGSLLAYAALSDNNNGGVAVQCGSASDLVRLVLKQTSVTAAFSEAKALSFITSLYDSSQKMVREYPDSTTYWLWSDNLLAQMVLRHSNPALSAVIKKTMDLYGIPMKTDWATLDPQYIKNTSFLGTTELTVPGTTNVKYGNYSIGGELPCSDYADVAFLKAIYKFKTGDTAGALACYNAGKAMWDGVGMKDTGNISGDYAVYKIALGLLAQKITGFASIGIPDNYFDKFQATNGGVTTDIVNGQPNGTQNVETTSAVLLAKNPALLDTAPVEQAAFDSTVFSQTTGTPTISGTASGVSQIGVVVSSTSGDKVYGSGPVPVTGGRWSVTVSPALSAGAYNITVYNTNNAVLIPESGQLIVAAPTGPVTKTYGAANDLRHNFGRADADGWSAATALDEKGTMLYGPYATDWNGASAQATFHLMVDNNSADDLPVATIDLYDSTAGEILAIQDIHRKSFTGTMTYQDFSVSASIAGRTGHALETRVYWHDVSYVRVSGVTVTITPPVAVRETTNNGLAAALSGAASAVAALQAQFTRLFNH